MRNNMNKKIQRNSTNIIYQFACPNDDCMYLGTNNIGS